MSSLLLKQVIFKNQSVDIYIENNRIQKIDTTLSVHADECVDYKNQKTILPAFYNGHTHAAMTLLRGYADDLPLFEWLNNYIWPSEVKFTKKHIQVGTQLACLEMIHSGTVFFNDMYWHHPVVIKTATDMGLRVCSGPIFLDTLGSKSQKIQQIALKKFLQKYKTFSPTVIPSLGVHAIYSVYPKTLERLKKVLDDYDFFFHIHLSETQKEVEDCLKEHGCTPAEYLDKKGLLSPKTLIAHGIHLTKDELKLLADRGATVVHMPVSNMKLSNGFFDCTAANELGVNVILGTDGASSNNCLDMMGEMKTASLFAKHALQNVTAMPAQKVFHMATQAAAETFGLQAGVIEEGKLADAILVDLNNTRLVPGYNILSDMVYSADSSCIDSVICNGRFLMKNKQIKGEDAIIEKALRLKVGISE
ncbi:MAG: amidohydrolase [Candidatus Marinimicrobia bacterium]|nr:amidohydrolase [Candidatus Neomarinimicrobiota bacterium]MDD5582234.1 amidohydrolase [Candidatus Neomarinimicrobiota bacterium]